MYTYETQPRQVFTHFTQSVSFGFYNSEEIKAMAVKEISNVNAFDSLGLPLNGGLYDPALGPYEREGGKYVLTNFVFLSTE